MTQPSGLDTEWHERRLAARGLEPAFDLDGVDLTQVRAALDRTPLERLVHHESSANGLRWLLGAAGVTKPRDVSGIWLSPLLRELSDGGVEFIVVGLLAAVLQGAPVVTLGLDILRRRTPENVARLLRVLARLDAVARGDPRRIAPEESHLSGPGHLLLDTRAGDLDVLGTIEDSTSFEDVIGDTIELDLDGIRVRVLELPRLIRAKEAAGRPKDLAALPVLRATLAELRKRDPK